MQQQLQTMEMVTLDPATCASLSARVARLDSGVLWAELGGTIHVAIWRQELTPERAKRLTSMVEARARSGASPAAVLCIVEGEAKPPDDAARRELARLNDLPNADMKCIAFVIAGGGFRGAVVRCVGVAIARLARTRYDQAFFGDVPSAVSWIDRHVHGPPPDSIVVAVERIWALLDTPVAP